QKEEWFITKLPYEKIVVSGKGYLSTEAISLLCENNKNVILTDTSGNPVSLVNSCMESMTATRYRIGQYDTFRDESKRKYLCRQIIQAKLESQIRFIESLKRVDSEVIISKLKQRLSDLETIEPEKIESTSAISYFRYYCSLFDSKFKFNSRNGGGKSVSKRRANDPINALLNYGYSVLAGQIAKYVCGIGLDPYYGFMHKQHTGYMPLVYDIMEPFRWLVESSVYHVANTKDSRHCIRDRDYAWRKDGSVVLSKEVKRKYLEKLERNFQKERIYKCNFGRKKINGMSMCQEIIIAKITIQNLADYCKRN
ncbi:MAG: CRISPR-associated endonuclease Cas1, partial [Nitrososphaeraceae archaeon]|nr:CRISPR-associated endonuclease Cas1 [Nitrososphaeraceae archaeon]